jgi:uncharacterized protein (TIGR02118 family)
MIAVTVLYPTTDGAHLDLDYYRDRHMRMVAELWRPMGLRNVRVLAGKPGSDGAPPPYALMTTLEFDDLAAFGAAVKAHGATLFGDVPNFTSIKPITQISEIMI